MLPSTRSIILDLIISNDEINGHPVVKDADRGELERHLTHVLVNDVTLAKHCAYVKGFKFDRPQLDASIVNSTVNTGLDALNNEEIAILALDPVSLETLFETIDKDTPEAWTPAIKREGLKYITSPTENDED